MFDTAERRCCCRDTRNFTDLHTVPPRDPMRLQGSSGQKGARAFTGPFEERCSAASAAK